MGTIYDYKDYLPAGFLEVIEAAQAFSTIEGSGSTGAISITEHDGGGETDGISIVIPFTSGPGIIPINNVISDYRDRIFLQYDKYTALTHELSHAVLNYLGILSPQEIYVAILAEAFDTDVATLIPT